MSSQEEEASATSGDLGLLQEPLQVPRAKKRRALRACDSCKRKKGPYLQSSLKTS